jgi:circadian clock protein KaiC
MRKHKPARVVFDSLSEFRLVAETALRYRRQLLILKQEFTRSKSTALLLDDKMDAKFGSDPHVLSLAHGVIEMEQFSPDYGVSRRRLRVLKMRGIKIREGYHDYAIATGGLHIFPRLIASEHNSPFRREAVSSGLKELDDLLGGGLDRGTTTLIIGPAGTGKSTLALKYVAQMASKGERAIIFAFEETRGLLLARAKALGLDLDQSVQNKIVNVQQVDPAELSPGEFAIRIRSDVEAGTKLVVIDSLAGYLNSMPGEKYLTSQLHELCLFLNQQGVVSILILPQHGLLATEASVNVSYLADTVISLRFFEDAGELKQAVAVVKKRSGRHEKTLREYKLETGKGIWLGQPLKEFQGTLTGVPQYLGIIEETLKASNVGK